MQKKAKNPVQKKAQNKAKKGIEGKAGKNAVNKKTKVETNTKAKKSPAKKIVKTSAGAKPKKKAATGKIKRAPKQPSTSIITHGKDQHFIPVRGNQFPATIRNSNKVEQLFQHNEKVAIRQENEEVKAGMAGRMGRKRIFRIP